MIHTMKLDAEPFEKIKNGSKTVELRLFDEKRQKIKPGDIIEFFHNGTGDMLYAEVVSLTRAQSFKELYTMLDKSAMGYADNQIAHPKDMEKYYSPQLQAQYGVVGIGIRPSIKKP